MGHATESATPIKSINDKDDKVSTADVDVANTNKRSKTIFASSDSKVIEYSFHKRPHSSVFNTNEDSIVQNI